MRSLRFFHQGRIYTELRQCLRIKLHQKLEILNVAGTNLSSNSKPKIKPDQLSVICPMIQL